MPDVLKDILSMLDKFDFWFNIVAPPERPSDKVQRAAV
jgi:hypothetical protein